jgi:hypothetical protein
MGVPKLEDVVYYLLQSQSHSPPPTRISTEMQKIIDKNPTDTIQFLSTWEMMLLQ